MENGTRPPAEEQATQPTRLERLRDISDLLYGIAYLAGADVQPYTDQIAHQAELHADQARLQQQGSRPRQEPRSPIVPQERSVLPQRVRPQRAPRGAQISRNRPS